MKPCSRRVTIDSTYFTAGALLSTLHQAWKLGDMLAAGTLNIFASYCLLFLLAHINLILSQSCSMVQAPVSRGGSIALFINALAQNFWSLIWRAVQYVFAMFFSSSTNAAQVSSTLQWNLSSLVKIENAVQGA